MNETTVEVILDSLINGRRVTTFSLWFPRFLLPQFNTHRVFSRNAASMRAIPTARVISDYAVYRPKEYRANAKGMQPSGVITDQAIIDEADHLHDLFAGMAKHVAMKMAELGIAKEQVNRYLEPISYVKVILTTTELDNFFSLRIHRDAQDEIEDLAIKIRDAAGKSIPEVRQAHLPFATDTTHELYNFVTSTARCARVSYYNHDGIKSDINSDYRLYSRLVVSLPQHYSPAEHQVVTPDYAERLFSRPLGGLPYLGGNLNRMEQNSCIIQYRKLLEHGIGLIEIDESLEDHDD